MVKSNASSEATSNEDRNRSRAMSCHTFDEVEDDISHLKHLSNSVSNIVSNLDQAFQMQKLNVVDQELDKSTESGRSAAASPDNLSHLRPVSVTQQTHSQGQRQTDRPVAAGEGTLPSGEDVIWVDGTLFELCNRPTRPCPTLATPTEVEQTHSAGVSGSSETNHRPTDATGIFSSSDELKSTVNLRASNAGSNVPVSFQDSAADPSLQRSPTEVSLTLDAGLLLTPSDSVKNCTEIGREPARVTDRNEAQAVQSTTEDSEVRSWAAVAGALQESSGRSSSHSIHKCHDQPSTSSCSHGEVAPSNAQTRPGSRPKELSKHTTLHRNFTPFMLHMAKSNENRRKDEVKNKHRAIDGSWRKGG